MNETDICFNNASHCYIDVNDTGQQYISVTNLIHKYIKPFDADFWSAYKALEKLLSEEVWGIEKKSLLKTKKFNKDILSVYYISEDDFNKTKQNILNTWDTANKEACERGTQMHADLEKFFYKNGGNLKKIGIDGKFECKKNHTILDSENGICPEYLIRSEFDGNLVLTGQIDLIVKQGNDITIYDWKSNKEIKTKSEYDSNTKTSIKMKYPLNTLDDINFNHYTLQLSTYAWMLQKIHPEFNIKDLVLIHFDYNNKQTIYHCNYLKHEVERMLNDYKKTIDLNQQRDRRKRIEY